MLDADDLSQAWAVMEKMRQGGAFSFEIGDYLLSGDTDRTWLAIFFVLKAGAGRTASAVARTPADAICKAAIRAKTGGEG